METASPLAVRRVLDAGGHLVRPPAADQSYLPAVNAPVAPEIVERARQLRLVGRCMCPKF